MVKFRIQDPHNPRKVWLVKKYQCYHYYLQKEICGRPWHTFQRMPKWLLNQILPDFDNPENEVNSFVNHGRTGKIIQH